MLNPIRRSPKGTGFIEAVCAAMILIPVALCLIDLIVLVIANSMNDTAVKNATRAAANQQDAGAAFDAVKKSLKSFKSSGIVKTIEIQTFDYKRNETVSCELKMHVKLPVPFPGINDLEFRAKDVEPVVSMK